MDKTIVDIDPETGKKEVTDTSQRDGYAVWVNEVGKVSVSYTHLTLPTKA